jgi:ribose transport system substrate-binding protein
MRFYGLQEQLAQERLRNRIARRRGLAVLCAATAASALLCGVSTNAGASTARSAGISSAIAASSSTGASGCVATATAKSKGAEAQLKLAALTPFKATALKGKKFAYIELVNSPTVQAIATGFSKAIATVGASPLVLNGEGQVTTITQDFQTAVAEHAIGIVALDISPSIAPAGYAAARAAKIPVVAGSDGDPTHSPAGVAAQVTQNAAQTGSIQVDYALAKTHCKLHAAYVYTPAAVSTLEAFNGAQAELKKLCPTNCTLDSVAANEATFQTSLSGQVETTLQRNPDINYLLVSTDALVPYTIQGAKAGGGHLPPIVGGQGTTLAAAMAGNGETADLLQAPFTLQGYWEADDIMRAAAGVQTNTYVIPQRMVDSKNWGTSASDAAQFPDLAGAPAAFEKAWGVKK